MLAVALSVSVCVCLPQVGKLLKRLNELDWVFLAWGLPPTHPTNSIVRKFGYLQT